MSISALIIDDERLARDELKYLLDSIGGVDVLAQGANGIEAVELIEEHQPDLVFLDVQMPGMDGFGVLERLMALRRQSGEEAEPMPQIVFATAFDQYAVRAFEVNAVDYLLKPFDRSRVLAAVERVRARLANGNAGTAAGQREQPTEPQHLVHANIGTKIGASVDSMIDSKIDALLRLLKSTPSTHGGGHPARVPAPKLIVQAQSRLLLIDQVEICFAAIDDGVIRIVTRTFEGQSKCRTLEELMELLDPAHFWRAHRGYVVNIDHIREVVPWFKSSYQLRMNDKQQTEIPVSRAQTKRLKELFNL
jgi:two-component system, LytTR family, response regulator LytT